MLRNIHRCVTCALAASALLATAAPASVSLESLSPDLSVADFRTEAVYENDLDLAVGARFRHRPTGFVLDLLQIKSVPQALMWVNSFPPSDQGEPHTCEHLLLGKGTRGRYVASLEDMSLGSSSAFTRQLQTCYHFLTAAGQEVFYELLEAKLDALLHPNFSDEEIRREVCNIGYRVESADGSLRLEEKGTVYNEMVSSFERPWSNLGRQLDHLLYGPTHPLAKSSGGLPAAIRTMTPEDLRAFHRDNYRLGNMGVVVALPDDVGLDSVLTRISAILHRVQPAAELGADPTRAEEHLPPPASAPAGEIRIARFPHQNEQEPGLLVFAWPPVRDLSNQEQLLLELLVDNLAGGATSDLYREFIDSRTRSEDLGANSVFGWVASDLGYPVYVGFSNVRREATEEDMIKSVRRRITARLRTIAAWADGSDELARFNERASSLLVDSRRELRRFLNSPPGYGERGTGARWYDHLKRLQHEDGFRKRLALAEAYRFAEAQLVTGRNVWRELLAGWQLLETEPYAVAARPDPELIRQGEEARGQRLDRFLAQLEAQQGTTDTQQAIESYRKTYDAATEEIESEARTIAMPGFVDSPPLSLDDALEYRVDSLPGGVPVVVSTFDNISSATVGLALRLDVVPESLLVFLPALPTLLTDVGVIRDGRPQPYDAMKEELRRDIQSLDAYFSTNHRTERAELVVRASGGDPAESERAVEWLATVLFSPDWRADNLDRIRDAVNLALKSSRNTMRGSEEAWVYDPAMAYWRQHNPWLLTAGCFLTQTHALHRLRWLLLEAATPAESAELTRLLDDLGDMGGRYPRVRLSDLLVRLGGESEPGTGLPPELKPWVDRVQALSTTSHELVRTAAGDLKQTLADIPDSSLAIDWRYLCRQIARDLAVPASSALAGLNESLNLLRCADNARAFLVAATSTQERLAPALRSLVAGLDDRHSLRWRTRSSPVVLSRLRARYPGLQKTPFVGLINENTRSGVFVNLAANAGYHDAETETLLRFLASRLYGGHGAHSMFMKTWGAGLAYSNGLRADQSTGRLIYYAERCPDLAQTMQFVVDELKRAPYDTSLAHYAIAQAFDEYRSGRRYEQRGEAMATDLADGLSPEDVKRFRRGVLALRDRETLFDDLHARMPEVYGQVLPGYGPSRAESPEAIHFVIGPEAQFTSYEAYLRSVEGKDATLYRLYPRDFWLVAPMD